MVSFACIVLVVNYLSSLLFCYVFLQEYAIGSFFYSRGGYFVIGSLFRVVNVGVGY